MEEIVGRNRVRCDFLMDGVVEKHTRIKDVHS